MSWGGNLNFGRFYKIVLMPQLNRKGCWFQLKGKENRKMEKGTGGFLQICRLLHCGDRAGAHAALPTMPPGGPPLPQPAGG